MAFYFFTVSLLLPLMRLAGFYHGFKIAKDIYSLGDILRESLPFPSLPAVAETDEERIKRLTAQNVENYGTGAPQTEVR